MIRRGAAAWLFALLALAGCGRFGFDLVGSGADDDGGIGDGGTDGPSGPPMVFGKVASVAVGTEHVCAVRDDGALFCWGGSFSGQLMAGASNADYEIHPTPLPTAVTGPISAVYANADHTCALLGDGTLTCAGNDFLSRLIGLDAMGWGVEPETITGIPAAITQASIGVAHICAVTVDKKLWCWGEGSSGQLGHNSTADELAPREVTALTGVVQVAAGYTHTCAVTDANRVYCWGHNISGQVGNGNTTDVLAPTLLPPTNIVEVTAGSNFTCARSSTGTLQCWGDNTYGQLGDGSTTPHLTPAATGITDATALAAGIYHACAVRAGGLAWCWGFNSYGQVGDGTLANQLSPVQVQGLGGVAELRTSGYSHTTCARTTASELWCWGHNAKGQLGIGHASVEPYAAASSYTDVADVAVGAGHLCLRSNAGAVRCVGTNAAGQLGNGTTTASSSPVTLAGITTAVAIGAGYSRSGAASASSPLQTWGDNANSQLGVGDAVDRPMPTSTGLANVVQVSLDSDHSCARTSGGQVFCWGANNLGQVGDNSTTTRPSPVQVTDLGTTAADVCVGGQTSCSVSTTGVATCWGSNSNQAIGDGTFTDRRRPAAVLGLPAAVAQLACGSSTNCARLVSGDVWCWGYDENGEKGDGTQSGTYEPSKVLLPTAATRIAFGSSEGCAVLDDGRVFCWGGGTDGLLGRGTLLPSAQPAEVTGLTGATDIYMGASAACAKRTDGSLWCWGGNSAGELGRGYRGDGWVPEQPWLSAP